MKTWAPIMLNHETFEPGYVIFDGKVATKRAGEFTGNWTWDIYQGGIVRRITNNQ
jgi:hypothetical protein